MAAISSALGILPASESLFAFTRIMNRMAFLLAPCRTGRDLFDYRVTDRVKETCAHE
jgi:hypothetical protein